MGVLPVAIGKVLFVGAGIPRLPPFARARLGMGYVPQGREIFPRLTVEENLLMGMAGKSNGAAQHIPAEIYDMFPVLKEMKHRRGGDLSGGQQQQLAIGRALAMKPHILILYEPTESIQPSIIKDIERIIKKHSERGDQPSVIKDIEHIIKKHSERGDQPSAINDIRHVIKTLSERGDMAILLVEQYYEFARELADHYVVLQRGEVVKSGSGEDMET